MTRESRERERSPQKRRARSEEPFAEPSESRRRKQKTTLESTTYRDVDRERWIIPALGLLLILVIGATRFAESRRVLGQAVALGVPVATMVAAVLPIQRAQDELRTIAIPTAGLITLGAELRLAPVILKQGLLPPVEHLARIASLPAFLLVLGVAALATVPLEAIAVKRGVGSRFAALAGIAVALALYLPSHFTGQDPFGAVLAGFFVALFGGGGVGLLLGALARSITRSRA